MFSFEWLDFPLGAMTNIDIFFGILSLRVEKDISAMPPFPTKVGFTVKMYG